MFNLIPTSVELELGDCSGQCEGCLGCWGCDGERSTNGEDPPDEEGG
jgi:hypothetical protein